MAKKKDDDEKQALTVRAFIKLLREGKTIEDLDRMKVYDVNGHPITAINASTDDIIIY